MLHVTARALPGPRTRLSSYTASYPGLSVGKKKNERRACLEAFCTVCSQVLNATVRRLETFLRGGRARDHQSPALLRSEDAAARIAAEELSLSLPEQGSLLHFEAGNGAFLERFHAARPQWELSAIESGPAFMELLGKDFLSSATNADYRDADICRRYDLIVVTKPLDAVNGPGEALAWLSRRLTDEGALYLRQPLPHANGASLFGAPHGVHIRIGSLITLCTAVGLAVKKMTTKDGAIYLCARKEARRVPGLPLGEHGL